MAAEPVKSPLHNFPLTFLKWGSKKDGRCRRTPPFESPLYPPPQPSDAESPTNTKPVGSRSSRNRRNNHHNHPTTPSRTATPDDEEERDFGKKLEVAEEHDAEVEGDCEKGWNLRPRRAAAIKGSSTANTTAMVAEITAGGDQFPKSLRLRGLETQGNGGVFGGCGSERKEKRKFWIALSRDEIEEDIYSMTGSKPSRRPRKRPKNVQKQLDIVFPGLWLVGITPEAYRGLDVPPKR